MGDQVSLSSFQNDLGIPINFQEETGLVTFQALNSTTSRDVMRCEAPYPVDAGTRVFSRVSTGDSDIPSSCDMKPENKYKVLLGNAFF